MSKLARKPIVVPEGVTVTAASDAVVIKGGQGTLRVPALTNVNVSVAEDGVHVVGAGSDAQTRANIGTTASLIRNAIAGVREGFSKSLEVEGIGFKAAMEKGNLELNVGFTHPVLFTPPAGVTVTVEKNVITVKGADKYLVGQSAAQIRKVRKPEPYKGKGIHYVGEIVYRKAGKKVAGAGEGKK